MNTTLIIYIWGFLDNFIAFCGLLFILPIVALLLAWFFDAELSFDPFKVYKKVWMIHVFAGLMTIFLPSSKTFAAMVVVPLIVESKAVQKDVPELYNMAIESLKTALQPKAEK